MFAVDCTVGTTNPSLAKVGYRHYADYLVVVVTGSCDRFAAAQAPGAIYSPRQCPCTTFHAKYSDGRKP